jgi:hypothetical protein
MSGFFSFITGAVGNVGGWVVRQATPKIFDSLVVVVKNWQRECQQTPNKFDDVLAGVVLKVVEALASTPEAQADPDADGGDDDADAGEEAPDPDPSTETVLVTG